MGRTQKIIELMGRLAPVEGYNLSALEDVRFLRSNRPLHRVSVLYDPGIVIVCQGRKLGYLGEEIYLYHAVAAVMSLRSINKRAWCRRVDLRYCIGEVSVTVRKCA